MRIVNSGLKGLKCMYHLNGVIVTFVMPLLISAYTIRQHTKTQLFLLNTDAKLCGVRDRPPSSSD